MLIVCKSTHKSYKISFKCKIKNKSINVKYSLYYESKSKVSKIFI